jgi:hypothetical protein
MAIETLKSEPACFTIGDTVSWTRYESDYLPPDWNLVYGFSGPTRFTIASSDYGDSHKITMPWTGLLPGDYVWTVKATTGTDPNIQNITLGHGTIRALPNLTAADAVLDTAEARLAALETAYANLSGNSYTSVSVDGVAFSRSQVSDLKAQLMFARREVERLQGLRRALLGQSGGNLFLTRFRT